MSILLIITEKYFEIYFLQDYKKEEIIRKEILNRKKIESKKKIQELITQAKLYFLFI